MCTSLKKIAQPPFRGPSDLGEQEETKHKYSAPEAAVVVAAVVAAEVVEGNEFDEVVEVEVLEVLVVLIIPILILS